VAIAYAELHHGGWYVRGGLSTLADALLNQCRERGVSVQLGQRVTAIVAAAGRVCGIRLADGSTVRADVVVANADALEVYRDLLPWPRRLSRLADRSLSGFVLLLGVRGRTAGMAHHTVFFPHDYDAEFDAVFGDAGRGRPARPAIDPTVYVTVADDPAVRPAGHEAWFVLVNAHRSPQWTGQRHAGHSAMQRTCWTCWPGAALTSGTGCCFARCALRPTSRGAPEHLVGRSTVRGAAERLSGRYGGRSAARSVNR
jgi:phytoene dehydrogenase-like protein